MADESGFTHSLIGFLFVAQPLSEGLQTVHVVADNLDGSQHWDGENKSHRAPDPSPKQQAESYGERIQFKASANNLGIKHVQREDVEAENDGTDDDNAG